MADGNNNITVRPIRRADVPAAQRIFKRGMLDTIENGARRSRFFRWGGCFAAGVVGLLIIPTSWGLIVRLLAAGCADFLVAALLPGYIASSYVAKSLAEDMRDPVEHTHSQHR